MTYLVEVERSIKKLSPQKSPKWPSQDYVGAGQSKLRYLEIKIPVLRRRFKEGYSFSALPAGEQWKIWDKIWHKSQYYDVMNQSFYWAQSRVGKDALERLTLLLKWQTRVDNWAHSDCLSLIYSHALERDPRGMMPVMEQWARSKNPWDNRQSLVGLFYYSSQRRSYVPFKTAIAFIERQMKHDHYYVQKGVGWALRETFNVYPSATFNYLKSVAVDLPPAAWTAATEKLKPREKKILKDLRMS